MELAMFHTKDHKTRYMLDPFPHFGPKRRKLLEQSWAKVFRDEILPELPVHMLGNHYHEFMGRPTKELFAMLGLMILQQMDDLSDEETVCQFAFNELWHYALDITAETGPLNRIFYHLKKSSFTLFRLSDWLQTPVASITKQMMEKLFYKIPDGRI